MRPDSQLHFELGGFEADGLEIRLSREDLLYSKTIGLIPTEPPQAIKPSEDQWLRFWRLVGYIGVWSWRPEYVNFGVLDGAQWSLSLSHAGRHVKCEGSNAYPGTDSIVYPDDGPFADFLRALARLTGQPDIAPQTR